MNLRQFKLTNNDEIICEVVEVTEGTQDVIIRKALKIMCAEDLDNNLRYYSFRPYVSFSDIDDQLVVLNSGHIISEVNPTQRLQVHYGVALKEVEASAGEINDVDFDDVAMAAEDMDDDEFRAYLKDLVESKKEEEQIKDSDGSNIIQFSPKGTVH